MAENKSSLTSKIALFIPSLRGGGAERAMLGLAAGLVSTGRRVDLIVANAVGPYLDEVPPDVRLVDLRARRIISSLPALISYIRSSRPDCLVSTPTYANVAAIWARALARVPMRHIVREASILSLGAQSSNSNRGRWMPHFVRLSYKHPDAIVAVSDDAADDLAHSAKIERDRISVIPNPSVTGDLFRRSREMIDHTWFRDGEPPVILAVGRLEKAKDYSTLIKAFDVLRRSRAARLLILGEGSLRRDLETLAGASTWAADIAMPGFVVNPFAYMARSSLFVLSSVYEGLPNVLIQALALGLPAVTTDCSSGPREIAQHDVPCTLVKVGDVSGMAEAMAYRLCAPRLNVPVSPGFLSHYSQKSVTQQYINLISAINCIA